MRAAAEKAKLRAASLRQEYEMLVAEIRLTLSEDHGRLLPARLAWPHPNSAQERQIAGHPSPAHRYAARRH
ncbi:hypothetical protein [Actinomadura fibrosa]|nr:hypothetical protein [Actinomadura fibrosa]